MPLNADQKAEVSTVRLALRLHKSIDEIDMMPAAHIKLILEVLEHDQDMRDYQKQRADAFKRAAAPASG